MKSKVLLTSLIFFSIFSSASNIRVIGNGGGDLEMRALTEFHYIPWISSLCMMEMDYCELDHEDIELLLLLEQSEDRFETPTQLEFHNSGELYIFKRTEGILSINATLLESATLSSVIFTGILKFAPDISFRYPSAVESLSNKIFKDREWNLNSLDLSNVGQLRFIEFSNRSALLVKNENDGLDDLTPKIESLLGCSSGAQLKGFLKPSREQSGFSTEVIWSCEGDIYQGVLVGIPSAGSWSFQVFGRRSLAILPTDLNCSQLLKAHHKTL